MIRPPMRSLAACALFLPLAAGTSAAFARRLGVSEPRGADRDRVRPGVHRGDPRPRLRAFDVESGRQLWRASLPAGARATPMTYEAGGRQYLVIAAGGGGPVGTGDAIVAFALKDSVRVPTGRNPSLH